MTANLRAVLQAIFESAIDAVQPARILRHRLRVVGNTLVVRGTRSRHRIRLGKRIHLIGVGKGVDLTAPVAAEMLRDRLGRGVLLVRDRLLGSPPDGFSIHVGSHPLPDERSRMATAEIIRVLRDARADEAILFVLMGGASSLLVDPPAGLSLEDKRIVTQLLLRSGMTIDEMNCIRKHLSTIKAGGLLRHAHPARVVTLAISDVIGDDPTVIGSAPTFYDPTTYGDAWTLLRRHHLLEQIPSRVRRHLATGRRGELPETMKPGAVLCQRNPFFLLASNRTAIAAAKTKAASLGCATTVLTTQLRGDSRQAAEALSARLRRMRSEQRSARLRRARCLLLGGETTVRVEGTGLGGRNQEFALQLAESMKGVPGFHCLSAATDGSDGPTDAAGAFVDGTTALRAELKGLHLPRALRENDSYPFFKALGDLFRPGPTGTNVLDLKIVLLE